MDSDIEEASDISNEKLQEENLPPGMRFVPTDSEIINYLKRYNWDDPSLPGYIHQIDLSDHHPRDLMRLYGMQKRDECFLISRRNKKYRRGHRPSRDAGNGFYKPTSRDTAIVDEEGELAGGVFKTLAYYEGKSRRTAKKTNWMIKEYRLGEPGEQKNGSNLDPVTLDGFVLCKLYESTRRRKKADDEDVEEEGDAIEEDHEEDEEGEGSLQSCDPEVYDEPNLQMPCYSGTDSFQPKLDWHSGTHAGSDQKPIGNVWRGPASFIEEGVTLPVEYGSNILNNYAPFHDVGVGRYDALMPLNMRPLNSTVPFCHSRSFFDPRCDESQGPMTSLIGLPISIPLQQQQQHLYLGNVSSVAANQKDKIMDTKGSYYQANLFRHGY